MAKRGMASSVFDLLKNPRSWLPVMGGLGLLKWMDDETYIKLLFRINMGYPLNLENPKTICEKLQWLKLYNRRPEYTMMADKYDVKEYVAGIVGREHVIPTYGVWDSFDEIDFDSLPDQFVLKCTHDSGGLVVCRDKASFDKEAARKKIRKSMKRTYYYTQREWAYRDIKPRILAEKYIDSLGKPESVEYKVTCFGGKVGFVTICQGIAHAALSQRTNDHYARDGEYMPWWTSYRNAAVRPEKPEQWDELIAFCEKLCGDCPYIRVDTYILDGVIYFGEFTFFTWAGFMKFNPPEWDRKLGDMIRLPEKKWM